MRIKKCYIALLVLLFCAWEANSQDSVREFCVKYRLNSSVIETEFSNNATVLQEMTEFLKGLDNCDSTVLIGAEFGGYASPEGPVLTNLRLAEERMEALEQRVKEVLEIPDSLITYNPEYISWKQYEEYISESDIQERSEILEILRTTEGEDRIKQLQSLRGGEIWQELKSMLFIDMRRAYVVIKTRVIPPVRTEEPEEKIETPEEKIEAVEVVVSEPEAKVEAPAPEPVIEAFRPKAYLKTNLVGAGLAIANLAAELDLSEHWSVSVPVYYSAWNYFKQTVKFRTFAIRPEIRYWLSEDNSGVFAGAHCGFAYYNFATGGEYRYQDRDGKSPALGGGVSLGYRLPISKDSRWSVELTLGAGVYSNHYDKFRNTPDTKDGLLLESVKTTYWGIDEAAVTISYSFDLKKKGGRR